MGALDFLSRIKRPLPVKAGAAVPATAVRPAVPAVPAPPSLPAVAVDELPADVRAKAAERYRFVELVRRTQADRRMRWPDAVMYVAVNHAGEFPILRTGGKGGASQLTYPNYRNWARLASGDAEASIARLADGYRRGAQPARGDAKFWEFLYAFYLNGNKLPLSVAYRRAAEKFRSFAPTIPVPSLAQARYQIGKLDLATLTYARDGEEACKNKCVDFIARDWSDVAAGQLVVGDSRTFDTRVRVWDEAKARWIAARPTIAALIDGRSWYFASYWITTDPVNADMLINTLALYCQNTGNQPPATAYFDRGKDYCAQGFSTPLVVDGVEHSIFRELGIGLVNATAYNARAKTVERAFRDMMQNFDKMFPDYLGSNPGQRTDGAGYFDTHAEELPSLQQFCDIFASWLAEYHATPKRGAIHRGKSPGEIWEARPARPALTPERLRFAFLRPEATRTVQRGPSVTLDNVRYYCDRLRVGREVLVKSDPFDPTHVVFFAPDGAVIGEGRTRDAIKALALDDAAARAEIARLIARQRRQLACARTTIDRLTGGRRQASPIELFLADPTAPLIPVGSRSSVKGASHHYRRVTLSGTIEPADGAAGLPAPLEFHEDAAAAKRAAFGEVVAPAAPAELATDAKTLADFHGFMTQRRRDDF